MKKMNLWMSLLLTLALVLSLGTLSTAAASDEASTFVIPLPVLMDGTKAVDHVDGMEYLRNVVNTNCIVIDRENFDNFQVIDTDFSSEVGAFTDSLCCYIPYEDGDLMIFDSTIRGTDRMVVTFDFNGDMKDGFETLKLNSRELDEYGDVSRMTLICRSKLDPTDTFVLPAFPDPEVLPMVTLSVRLIENVRGHDLFFWAEGEGNIIPGETTELYCKDEDGNVLYTAYIDWISFNEAQEAAAE